MYSEVENVTDATRFFMFDVLFYVEMDTNLYIIEMSRRGASKIIGNVSKAC